MRFPPDMQSIRRVRRIIHDMLAEVADGGPAGDVPEFVDDVVLLASELCENAVLHAGTESHLTLDLDSGLLSATVADSGNRGEPLLTGADTMAVRGRGLSLVRGIADAFGAHRTSAGTTVWFEVAVQLTPVTATS